MLEASEKYLHLTLSGEVVAILEADFYHFDSGRTVAVFREHPNNERLGGRPLHEVRRQIVEIYTRNNEAWLTGLCYFEEHADGRMENYAFKILNGKVSQVLSSAPPTTRKDFEAYLSRIKQAHQVPIDLSQEYFTMVR